MKSGNVIRRVAVIALVLGLSLDAARAAELQGAEGVLGGVQAAADRQAKRIDRIAAAAEAVADQLIASDKMQDFHFFAIGNHEGLNREANSRAGGFMGVIREYYSRHTAWIERAGTFCFEGIRSDDPRPEVERAVKLAGIGVLLVGIGREAAVRATLAQLDPKAEWPFAAFVDNALPDDAPISLESASDALALWLFSGELIGACSRRGYMPRMFYSVQDARSEGWNSRKPPVFHDDFVPPPVPQGAIARTYLAQVRKSLDALRSTQLKRIKLAAQTALEAHRDGYAVHWIALSHLPPTEYQLGDMPGFLKRVEIPRQPGDFFTKGSGDLKEGDVIIFVGYNTVYLFNDVSKIAETAKARMIAFITPGKDGVFPKAPENDIYIDCQWRIPDACVEIAGYGPRVLPLSGVTTATAMRMFTEEIRLQEAANPALVPPAKAESATTSGKEVRNDLGFRVVK